MSKSGDILIGRKADGTKVYVEARMEYVRGELWRERTDHTWTTERLRLAITGAIVNWNGSIDRSGTWQGAGQTRDDLFEITRLEPGWTIADVVRLRQIWQDWHLNDMRAGCIHQSDKDSGPCPHTGYKHGESWLFESLPLDVFSFIADKFGVEPPVPGSVATA